jgi:hypothetical protein
MFGKQLECSYKIEQGKMTMIMETKSFMNIKTIPKILKVHHPSALEY